MELVYESKICGIHKPTNLIKKIYIYITCRLYYKDHDSNHTANIKHFKNESEAGEYLKKKPTLEHCVTPYTK